MAKALKIVGTVAVIAGLAVVTGGAALGLGLALSTTAFGISAGALIAAGTLLSTAGSLLSAKPKAPTTSGSNADRLSVSIDTRAPRKIIFGRTAMATDLRDQEWSADQAYLHRFLVNASHRVAAYREIWFDDVLAWTSAGGPQGKYAGYLSVTVVTEGSPDNAINIGARMGSNRRYTGCAYVYLRYKLTGNDKKAESPFASAVPTRMTIIGDGALVYDPRLDSTVPGGAGSMRAGDQSTWAWSDSASRNPALALLFYLLGWRIRNPSTGAMKLAVGKGIPPARLDLASFITAANVCDETVTRADGGTEPRYRCDGIFSEADDPALVLDNLKATMNAVLDDVDGRIRLSVLYNDLAAPRGELTAADVLGEFTWSQTPPLNDSVNAIRGGFTDPSSTSLYQLIDYPEVRIDSPDGIDRAQTVNLPLVQSAAQAQRLVRQRLARAQFAGTFTAVFQATAWKYQKGDVIRFTFYPLGWNQKLFRIADMAIQVDGTVPMMMREEHPSIYAAYSNEQAGISGAAPTVYDPTLWPIVQGIVDAIDIAEEVRDDVDQLRTEIDNALETIEEAADAIRGISDDGILTIDEKIRILKPADAQLEAAWQLLDGQAAGISDDTAVTSARTTASNARQAWLTYRNGLSPAWNNLQQATAINRTTFNGKLGDYEWSLTNLAQALRDYGLRRTNAAFETVARLGSDGWLTAGSEKQQVEIEYQALVSRLAAVVNRWQGLGQPALSPAAALSDAGFALYPEYGPANGRPASLGYYLEHLNPSYLSRNTDTQVDPAEWSTRWKTAYDKIAIAEAALIGIVSSAVQSAADAIAVISADGKWSPYEKRSTLLQQHAELEANYTLLNNAAAAITGSAALDTARSTAGTKRQAWLDFLNTVPSWSNPDVETTVNRGEARSKVVAYGDALNALAEALRVYTDSKAVSALQRLDDIANDGKIAPEEKWQTVMLWRNLVNRYQRGVDRYLELGLQSGRIQAVSDKQFAAYNALGPDGNAPASSLGKTLGSLTPPWDQGNVTTIVPDPAALKAKFEAASNAVDAFLIAMSAQPDADNTSSAIASGAADGTINNKVNASPKLSKLDSTGRAVSTRINSIYALRGAQQVYIPTNGNSNQGGTVQAGVPGSPLWSYTDPGGGPTATIQVFDHKLIDDEGTLNFGGGFMFNVQQGTQYWVYEDGAGYSGGNPTYVATTSAEALNAPNRRMVGSTFTPRTAQVGAGGGTSGGGGGGGGIRERYYENQRTVQP